MAEGFKDYVAGQVLTAAQVDDYLMRQAVMRFADASARDTALSGVTVEGMAVYLKDNNRLMTYSGSVWRGVRSVAFAQTGTGITTSASATSTTNTLSIPDQGCAGTLNISLHLRVDKSVTSDVFNVHVYDGTAPANIGLFEITTVQTINYVHITTSLAQAAGVTADVRVLVTRSSGSGTGTTYTDALVNRLDVIFVPTA